MSIKRKVIDVYTPSGQQGFLGTGHIARPVVKQIPFEKSDPFIVLMDDRLEKK